MGYGASLMAAWTALLLWAYRSPIARAFVAPLTILVIYGLAATKVAAVVSGVIPTGRMIPTCRITRSAPRAVRVRRQTAGGAR